MSDFITDEHRQRLDELTDDDEQWETLAGHLYDPHAVEGTVCPDAMVEFVAKRYVLTTKMRVYYLGHDGYVAERSTANGRFNVTRNGARWNPTVKGLMARVFPEVLCGDYEYTDEDQGREPWMEHLRERRDRRGAAVKKRTPTEAEVEAFNARWRS